MTLEELEAKVEQLSTMLEAESAEAAAALLTIEALKADNKKLADENVGLDKEITITRANVQAEKDEIEAEKIMTEAFALSTLNEKLHGKVKKIVTFKNFKTESGEFDRVAFTAAFQAEVKDWEDRVSEGAGAGLGAGHEKEISQAVSAPYADENKGIVSRVI